MTQTALTMTAVFGVTRNGDGAPEQRLSAALSRLPEDVRPAAIRVNAAFAESAPDIALVAADFTADPVSVIAAVDAADLGPGIEALAADLDTPGVPPRP